MEEAFDVLETVLQEMYEAEADAMRRIYDIVKRNAEKYKSMELEKLTDIIRLWTEEPMTEILEKLRDIKKNN